MLINNAYAVTLKVDITNSTSGEKMTSYPFSAKISGPGPRGKSEKPETLEFNTGPEGVFESEINVKEGSAIEVEVNYRGISYTSQTREVKTGMETFSFMVSVYSITDKMQNIAVTDRRLTLVPLNEKVIQVYEWLKIENSGNKTFIGKFNDELDVTQVLYVPMPKGYELTGLRGIPYTGIYTLTGGVVTREDIKPGTHEVLINYYVKSDTGFFDFSLFTRKDAPEMGFMSLYFTKDDRWKINYSGLKAAGEEQIADKTYYVIKGMADSASRISIYGPTYEGTAFRWGMSIIVIFAVLLACLYLCRNSIQLWQIKQEKKRLESLLSGINNRDGRNDVNGGYQPFLNIVHGRLKEIERRIGT
jgi:hypothetical protein